MDHGNGDGMMADSDMEHLKGMKGAAFDKMFAEDDDRAPQRRDQHGRDERKNGEYMDAVEMAGDIVKGQSGEVKQLKSILDRL